MLRDEIARLERMQEQVQLARVFCACGKEITRNQHCAESDEDYAKRLSAQRCRSKCARLYPPSPPSRVSSLEGGWFNHQRPELRAVVKPHTPRDPAYLDYVRLHDCVGCGWPAHLGEIQAHHIETGMMGKKCSDYLTVPLCSPDARGCHAAADKSPESAEKYRPYALMLQTLWVKAGNKLKK